MENTELYRLLNAAFRVLDADFCAIDRDRSRFLSPQELIDAFGTRGDWGSYGKKGAPPTAELATLITKVDTNHSGALGFAEFAALLYYFSEKYEYSLVYAKRDARILSAAFDFLEESYLKFDSDRSRKLSENELFAFGKTYFGAENCRENSIFARESALFFAEKAKKCGKMPENGQKMPENGSKTPENGSNGHFSYKMCDTEADAIENDPEFAEISARIRKMPEKDAENLCLMEEIPVPENGDFRGAYLNSAISEALFLDGSENGWAMEAVSRGFWGALGPGALPHTPPLPATLRDSLCPAARDLDFGADFNIRDWFLIDQKGFLLETGTGTGTGTGSGSGNSGSGSGRVAEDPRIEAMMGGWDFDIRVLEKARPTTGLQFVAETALRRLGLLGVAVDWPKMGPFLAAVSGGYHPEVPYHNSFHGADVVQATYFLLETGGLRVHFDPLELFSMLIGAAVHDLDHPGLNNNYEIATRSDRALVYNDVSPLENHHAAQTFLLMRDPGLDILAPLPKADYARVRQCLIDIVLATDLKAHFAIVAQLKALVSAGVDSSKAEDRLMMAKAIVKCADVSNPARPTAVMDLWTDRFVEETFAQGDKEKALGLPISAFMDRQSTSVPKLELGFVDYLVRPLYTQMTAFAGQKSPVADVFKTLERNYATWKERFEKEQKTEGK
eukprot:TRINITY_DN96_c0_g3_i2.p1 TRINITY_DN96_c0_g3~~TRINITY_DN96_c0_g3_i2.p1  ORF type:complete len:674 (+),score=136.94 TRINITY_DN96_c0_g3_i2:176-2197(+)